MPRCGFREQAGVFEKLCKIQEKEKMAEIKSTLDLVMEKTRHLALSREEKEENERREFARRLQGVLQNFEDGRLDFTAVEEKISRLLEKCANDAGDVVCRQLAARMGAGKENGLWIDLLARFCQADADRLNQAAESARLELSRARQQRGRQLQDEFAAAGIRGSAVRPNLDGDPVVEKTREKIQENFKRTLQGMIQRP